mmetsp:Transcript_49073/g.116790  ORF Transcript_49073/g.116790 Transcript_49073/m.116790 type:complete len:411 (-) Transcript_49073:89-1321(-)|eukprot:CAMPEP_0178439218 /NCGR_PEP_ID=MMETSP0689_2-20121128/36037_1 /TAXON_ID=160604 /ORGANISM="Amphidinium massartii, Strain CS-259" /LENGTH=410 /DNA_ID=CAMNT_0020061729 /DNA_START=43 /DNA_END=1275 /DNA_ORIENTATION=+
MSWLVSRLLFPAPPPTYKAGSYPNELVWIRQQDDVGHCGHPAILQKCSEARYLVIYFHSNGEDIGLCYSFGQALRVVLEVHVLLVEYPGYGLCPGTCSEESMWKTAASAIRFATEDLRWPIEDIIIMGRSLGAALAVQVAAKYPVHGAVLISPFLSLRAALQSYVGPLAHTAAGNLFMTEEHILRVKVPLLVLHGKQDSLIPSSHGQKLCELCPSKSKLFVCPSKMAHNSDLLSDAEFLVRPMLRFFPLPDYSFVDMAVPAEAFIREHPSHYHRFAAMAKQQRFPSRSMGDTDCAGSEEPQAEAEDMMEDQPTAMLTGPVLGAPKACAAHSGDPYAMEWQCTSTPRVHSDTALLRGRIAETASTASPNASSRISEGGSPSDVEVEVVSKLPGWSDLNLDDGITRFLNERH